MPFDSAVSRLNSGDLDWLLRLSSLLSTVELLGSHELGLFPTLNNETTRLFSQAVLVSRAAFYKSRRFDQRGLVFVLNNASDALNDPRLSNSLVSGQPRDDLLFAARKIFSAWANIQLRQQRNLSGAQIGRMIALLDELPPLYLDRANSTVREKIADSLACISSTLGCTVRDLAHVFVGVLTHYREAYRRIRLEIECCPAFSTALGHGPRTAFAIRELLRNSEVLLKSVEVTPDDVYRRVSSHVSRQAVDQFFSLFARQMSDLRDWQSSSPFMFGVGEWRLSAFERFPLTRLKDDGFVAPNVRTLLSSFGPVIDRTLSGALGTQYTEVLGPVLELYVLSLVGHEYPEALLVPERPYKVGRSEYRGPDFLFAEAGQPLVAMEVKARRVLAETRATLDSRAFDRNFGEVVQALSRLQEKIQHLRQNLPEYSDVQERLNDAISQGVCCVCVLPETVYFMTEMIVHCELRDPKHPMNSFHYPYCVMSIENLEFAVAVAKQKGSSLAEILIRFAEQARNLELRESSPELFDGAQVDEGSLYGVRFIENS